MANTQNNLSIKQAPRKIAAWKIAAIVLISFTIVISGFYVSGFFDDFGSDLTSPTATPAPLTPARNLEGTWKTTFSTKFYIKTDYATFQELEDVGSENRTMTWTITATSDENIVNVKVEFTSSNRQLISDSGYIPDVSPMSLKGTISGTRLTLTTTSSSSTIDQIGTVSEFSFTTDIITGTWHDHWNGLYEQEVYTATNGLILAKQ